MDYDKKAIGNRIKSIRQSRGMTLEEFGLLIDDSSKSNVSKWETGVSIPNNKRLKLIATLGRISVNELLHGSNYEIKAKVTQYTDEIMNTEIKEFNSQKYKKLYDLDFKSSTIEYLVKHHKFEDLTDIGMKGYIKHLLDLHIDKEIYEEKFKPYSNKNAIDLAYDELSVVIQSSIDSYFRDEDVEVVYFGYLESNEIKENLSYELYKNIRSIIEKAREEIGKINNEEF